MTTKRILELEVCPKIIRKTKKERRKKLVRYCKIFELVGINGEKREETGRSEKKREETGRNGEKRGETGINGDKRG